MRFRSRYASVSFLFQNTHKHSSDESEEEEEVLLLLQVFTLFTNEMLLFFRILGQRDVVVQKEDGVDLLVVTEFNCVVVSKQQQHQRLQQ